MPFISQIPCLALAVGSSAPPPPPPPMQMLPRRARYRVVRLRPNQLVAELETAMHLPQDTFLLQPGERFPRPGGSQVHDLVQRQVRKAAAEHRGEIQRRAGPPVEPSNLALEHGADRAGDADVRDRVRVQRPQA